MRQSANNPRIEYSANWRSALEVLGKGKVCEKDLDRQGDKPGDRAWTGEYTGVELPDGETALLPPEPWKDEPVPFDDAEWSGALLNEFESPESESDRGGE